MQVYMTQRAAHESLGWDFSEIREAIRTGEIEVIGGNSYAARNREVNGEGQERAERAELQAIPQD